MKTLVIDFAASIGGAMTILKEYYEKAKKDKNNSYVFAISDNYLQKTNNIDIIILKKEKKWTNRLIFDHFTGKNLVNRLKPDKVLSLQNTVIRGIRIPQTLYIHQAIPFQDIKTFSFFKKAERKLAIIQRFIGHEIKKSAKIADGIIVQTNWMKNAVSQKCHIDAGKIIVKKPVVEAKINKKIKVKYNKFFYPTSNAIYKNNQLIYDAVKLLEDDGYDDFVVELAIDGESTRHIKKIGRIPHNKIMKKYQESVLLFPSYIETIGLPLLEAQKCGATIIAADTPFAREVLKKYKHASYFNYSSESELKVLMAKSIKRHEAL